MCIFITSADIIGVNTGLRPFRVGGPRIEAEEIDGKLILHNYGHGGSGWAGLRLRINGGGAGLGKPSRSCVPYVCSGQERTMLLPIFSSNVSSSIGLRVFLPCLWSLVPRG